MEHSEPIAVDNTTMQHVMAGLCQTKAQPWQYMTNNNGWDGIPRSNDAKQYSLRVQSQWRIPFNRDIYADICKYYYTSVTARKERFENDAACMRTFTVFTRCGSPSRLCSADIRDTPFWLVRNIFLMGGELIKVVLGLELIIVV